jgi:hypothetical protein
MKPTARLLGASSVLPLVLLAVSALGCGGPPRVRSAEGTRLPANGAISGAPASALPAKAIAPEDFRRAVAERLKPTCDGRDGARTADARNLEGAGKILGAWTSLHGRKGKAKSTTADGKQLGGGAPEPTRDVSSIGLTCAAGASTVQVNGVLYPFDVAWVVSGKGKGKSLDGTNDAGEFVMIQALSYKDKRVVFAKVYVPSDANDDTDDTIIVTSLAGYLPEDAEDPVVRAVSDREDPEFETLMFTKGTSEGLSFRVPEEDPLGRARYLGVARFSVGK